MRKPLQVPQANRGLIIKAVTSLIDGVVADIARLIIVQETKRTVIKGQPEDRHVVRIHDAMRKAHRLPAGNQACGTGNHIPEPENVFIRLVLQMRPVVTNGKISQLANLVRLAAIVKVLKMAEAQMALRNTHQHCPFFHRFARYRRIAGDNRQRARSGNTQGMHRFGRQALANR